MTEACTFTYYNGLLVADTNLDLQGITGFAWDPRLGAWSAPGYLYRDTILQCLMRKIKFLDSAKAYEKLLLTPKSRMNLRPYQAEALSAWEQNKMYGTVCLPTGAGKTVLAMAAIDKALRSTLVVVPTIELVHQWQKVIGEHFGCSIGQWGDGKMLTEAITVSTYDSAAMHIEKCGDKFGLLIFDECHHLPAPGYQKIALVSLAPFRLGLSATLERADGKESVIYELVGPIVYQASIKDLASHFLSPYDVVTLEVPFSEDEQERYREAREYYTDFIKEQRINMSSPQGWQEFIIRVARSPRGSAVMQAYLEQKKLAQGAQSKLTVLWDLLIKHKEERMIIFTENNQFAYHIGQQFFLPVLTHKTKSKERKKFLDSFKSGEITTLVTSKVLNEGVDVPEASVGVVMSGNATVREHVQRLGRILRPSSGKRATLYELITQGSNEHFVSKRRRQHSAYQK